MKIEDKVCKQDNSYSGKPCTSWLNLIPGTYKIYTMPWGKKSNEVSFTINSGTAKNIPSLTKLQAETLVHKTWSDCSQGDCGGVAVTVSQNNNSQYVVTAIFTELDDSISQTKEVSTASYQNGTWTLGQPTITWACHRGHVDGSLGFTSALCI